MRLAARLGVEVVATFAGQDPRLNVEENIPAFRELFSRYCDAAHGLGVRMAIENCPMIKPGGVGRDV